MHVFVTGATGFIGSYVLRELQKAGHQVRCLVHGHVPSGISAVKGDLTRPETLRGAMDGCDAVIHLVGIIDEHLKKGVTYEALHIDATRNVIQEAQRAGIARFVHMSSNGAAADGVSRYQTTKWQAECEVRAAGFRHWSILRPSVVFGEPPPGTIEFCTRLARELIVPYAVIPLFGRGDYQLMPVSVEEVASALVQSVTLASVHGQAITAVGWESLTYKKVIDRITLGLGRKLRPKVSTPVALMRGAVKRLGPRGLIPISIDQFEMLIRGNVGDPAPFYAAFDLTPKAFTPENLAYLKRRV